MRHAMIRLSIRIEDPENAAPKPRYPPLRRR